MTDLLYTESVVTGRAGYAPAVELERAWDAGRFGQVWQLGARMVSARLTKAEGGGMWKCVERLPLEEPGPMLDALEAAGIHHPSSWSDCFHQLAPRFPPLRYTYNGLLSWWPGGPWEEARRVGKHRGHWWRYDLRSAYRWAGSLGLPDPESYSVTTGPVDGPGIWLLTLRGRTSHLPNLFQGTGPVVMTTEEVEGYGVASDVIRGIQWESNVPGNFVDETLAKIPFPKPAARAYWGRWIARDPLHCWTPKTQWSLPNLHANFLWGWLIIGRVRLRVWEVSQEAAHVYIDEVVVPHPLPTGDAPGDWHTKEEYPRGVHVHRTGWYGAPGQSTMQTGVSHHARRN